MRLVAIVALWLVLLAVAAPAGARHRMTFEFASAVAVDYWAGRGVTVPCRPSHYVMTWAESRHVDELFGGQQVEMLTDRVACQIVISPLADSYRSDVALDWMFCADLVHEYGHVAGLGHDYGGVMDAEGFGTVPFGCAHQRQWMVRKGWRRAPRWVRRSPREVRRLWLTGHVYAAWSALRRLR